MKYSENFGHEFEQRPGLAVELQKIAERFPVTPRQLTSDQLPVIRPHDRVGPELETAYLDDVEQKRLLFYGDGHGLLFPFLNKAVKKGIVQLPLRQVLNLDFHADIATYTQHFVSHTASWQRYGVDKGFWGNSSSYNWQPEHSTAKPRRDFTPEQFRQSVSAEQAADLALDLLSIDIDFFNDLDPKNPKFSEYLETLKQIISKSKCVFVFSSSGWTGGKVTPETLRQIIENIQNTFLKKD